MSRFCFCNCPAGFSAEPERHAPDCPGRSGAGKTRTPVPATTPALTVNATEELDAVLHWRGKHTQAIRERDALQVSLDAVTFNLDKTDKVVLALQQRLTAADERADTATSLIQRIVANFDTEIEYHEEVEPNDLEHDQVLTEMREFLSPKDADWRMNPCKNGHRDVGAAGGVAHCYTCDEKITAANTQEAFEQWNATHPAT